MSMQGQVYAGLVGEIAEKGTITKSYAYNFGKIMQLQTMQTLLDLLGKLVV